ncbi:M20 family metallopeptidase [Sulfobacillus harzensis]|uniref:M20 family metallopeptidase n=1 Tax=Sulfobacillus harzensis TaxID=2729629 RepID=A0A7Y0L5H2_9FIRM|nr:M20 family metallopeptidase [Sulfobacillus harzensis]NMP23590.1 M20 family metallopeptidase [Sulfobacillus harzensis]
MDLIEDAIREQVNLLSEEATARLEQLIRIPTVNPPGEHYEDFVAAFDSWLRELGYDTRIVRVPEALLPILAPHAEGRSRPSVVGRMEGPAGPGLRIHLNGHYDVVPAGDDWTCDPFAGEVRNGRMYGRGAADQKSGLVMQVLAVEALRRAGVRWRGTITQSAVPDEETVGNRNAGTGFLVEEGIISRDNTDAVIITEPFGPDGIGVGHKGAIWGRVTVYGRQAHGSSPKLGVNAVELLASALHRFQSELVPKLGARLSPVEVTPTESVESTLSFDTFRGGVATNVIPARAQATFNRRLVPGETVLAARAELRVVLEDMAREHSQFRYDYEEFYTVEPILVSPDEQLPRVLADVLRRQGLQPRFLISAGSDDQRFVVHGANITNAVIYGPGQTSLAHQSDEYIDLDNLLRSTQVLALSLYQLLR